MKSLELRIHEGVSLVKALDKALALERYGGTPLTHKAYVALHNDAKTWIAQNDPDKQ